MGRVTSATRAHVTRGGVRRRTSRHDAVARAAPRDDGVRGDLRRRPARDSKVEHGGIRDARVRRACGDWLRTVAPEAPRRLVVARRGHRSLRCLCSTDGSIRTADVRRIHQARRHSDLPGDDRSRADSRPQPGWACAVDLRGDACNKPCLWLPPRLARATWDRARTPSCRRSLALAALPGVPRCASRARSLCPGTSGRCFAAAHGGRLDLRCAAGVAVRVLALGRDQGTCSGGSPSGCCGRNPGGAAGARSPHGVIPLAVLCGAIVGTLSLGGAIWLVPLLLGVLILLLRRRRLRETARRAAVFTVAFGTCALPSIVAAVEWLPRSKGFSRADELGNLRGPLRWLQVSGIWPTGDFRASSNDPAATYILVGAVAAAAAAALAWAAWARRWEIVLYAVAAGLGAVAIAIAGSPWVGAKAYAIASPAVPFLALTAAAALAIRERSIEASLISGIVAAAIIGGIAWSNVLAYRTVWLAPASRLSELEYVGERFAGEGPALMTEYEPYGARHFLRRLDAEGASELRRHFVFLRSGQPLASEAYTDIDRIRLSDLLLYRTLVLRRSPVESRPPSITSSSGAGSGIRCGSGRTLRPTGSSATGLSERNSTREPFRIARPSSVSRRAGALAGSSHLSVRR